MLIVTNTDIVAKTKETNMKSGRGLHMKKKGLKTREAIKNYIASNPNAIKRDVCEALDIGYITLRKHLKELEK